jgi:hypothetical protein
LLFFEPFFLYFSLRCSNFSLLGWTVSTIGEEKRWNARFAGRSRSEFIELMNNLNLPHPKKMLEAVPANQRCGKI